MGSVSVWIWMAFLLWPLRLGLTGLATLERAAGEFAEAWQEEYRWRQCLALAAAAANLDDAATRLSRQRPEARAKLEGAKRQMVEAMERAYGRDVGEGVTLCRSDGQQGLVGMLHRQRHTGQPRDWPNWVGRLVEAADVETQGGQTAASDRGAVEIVVVALLAGTLVLGCLAAACLLVRGVNHGLALLDDESSPLMCAASPDRMPASGPALVAVPGNRGSRGHSPLAGVPAGRSPVGWLTAGGPPTVPCLPRRLDYAAPGRPQQAAPEAICALLRQAGLPAALGGSPCP